MIIILYADRIVNHANDIRYYPLANAFVKYDPYKPVLSLLIHLIEYPRLMILRVPLSQQITEDDIESAR